MQTTEEKSNLVQNLPQWKTSENGKLERNFEFRSFPEAFSFLTRIALEAEKMNHHPDIYISQRKVRIRLFTYSQNRVTEHDTEMAAKIDQINWLDDSSTH